METMKTDNNFAAQQDTVPVKRARLLALSRALGSPTHLDVLDGDTVDDALIEMAAQRLAGPDYQALYEKAARQYNELAELMARPKAEPAEQQEALAMTDQDSKPRVLVVVKGGIADPVYDEGVHVEVFDWDNYNDDPEGTGGVPPGFADLATPSGIPVEKSDDMPGPMATN